MHTHTKLLTTLPNQASRASIFNEYQNYCFPAEFKHNYEQKSDSS